jgi:predicted nucleotidyltransferase
MNLMSSIQVVRKKREALAVPDLFRLLRFLSQQPYKMAVSGEIPSLTMANAVGLDPRRREWLNDGYLGRSVEVRFLFARSDWQQLEGLKVPNSDQILLRLVDAQEEAAFSSNHAWARSERMRITKEEIVAGHSAVQVRGFLRRFKHGFFMHSAAESFLQLNSRQVAEFFDDLVALELIEPTAPFGGKAAFQVAMRGHAFANATAAKPISRETAERVLREFVDRVNAVNASKEYAFIVKSAVLFGSMLSGVDRLGDVDVAIDLRPRNLDSAEFRQKCDRRRHLAEDLGRAFPSVFEWATWPQKEVVQRLKARSRSLSLHDFDQLMGMENLRYRVLVGDAISIASQISNGCAV